MENVNHGIKTTNKKKKKKHHKHYFKEKHIVNFLSITK